MKFSPRRAQSGFTLLEVLLAIGISLALGAAALTDLRRDNESKQAMAVGQQLATVGNAVNTYLALHYSQIVALSNVPSPGNAGDPGPRYCTANAGPSPFGGGTSSICTITTDTLVRSGLLPVSFSGRNAFGAQYNIYIRVTGTATPIVDGMVITDTPYTTGGGVRYDLLGQAMQTAGADSGMTRTVANRLEGLNGTWGDEAWPSVTHDGRTYPGLNARGLLAYRSGYGSSGYAAYLRLDGTTPMNGDLQMDEHNIIDVNNFVGRRAQLKGNEDGTDAEILTLRADPANANSVDRTAFVSGAGTTSIRNQNGVSFQNLAGTAGGRVNTGDLVASGNLNVTGSAGNNGDITATRNVSIGNDLSVGGTVAIADGLNVTGGGASITGTTNINGNVNVAGTNTLTAYNLVATNALNAGGYTLNGSGLTNGGSAWFYDNSVAAWRTTSGLQVDGAARVGSLGVDGNATVGNSLQLTGSASGSTVAAGSACANANMGTLRRATSGVVVQCVNGYWQSNGLQTTTVSAYVTATGGYNLAIATCPTGTKLIAGGYYLTAYNPTGGGKDSSSPSGSFPVGNSWYVQTGQDNGNGTAFESRAICSY